MGFDFREYNTIALDKVHNHEPIYNNAALYGVNVTGVDTEGEAYYWRVICVHHLSGDENRGNHHVFIDVLDADGQRVNGAVIWGLPEGQVPIYATVDKPDYEPGTNFPLWQSLLTVAVADTHLSEYVAGLSHAHADEDTGNTWGHHSFYIVFQLTPTDAVIPPPPPEGELTLEEVLLETFGPLAMPHENWTPLRRYADDNSLGQCLSDIYTLTHGDTEYEVQVYEEGIVYVPRGSDDVMHLELM